MLKNRVHVIFSAILAFSFITSQVNEVFSLLTTESILASSGVIRYMNPSLPARPLHVEGNQIKNDLGETVYLRGWNKARVAQALEPNWGGWKQYLQSKVDLTLDRMKSYGADVVRVHTPAYSWISNVNVTTETGAITYRQCLDDLLTRAEQRGIYVIIDLYTLFPKDCPIHGYDSPDHKRDDMGFDPYTSLGHEGVVTSQTAFANLWANIVDVLGSHQNLIIEPWNEPFAESDWNTLTKLNIWQSAWQETVNAIRNKETAKGYVKHPIVIAYGASLAYWGNLGDPWKNFNWYWTHPITDPAHNLIYSLHCYRHWGSVGSAKPYDYSTIKQIYIDENVYDLSRIEPVLIGEVGAKIEDDTDGNEYRWYQNTVKIFNEWGLGYIAWSWRSAGKDYDQLETDTENTNPTVNKYGQLTVDAIKSG